MSKLGLRESRFRLSINKKLLFEGVGKTYGCTCSDYNHPENRYHTRNCASYYNLTFHHRLNLKQRLKARRLPSGKNLTKEEVKTLLTKMRGE